MRYYLKYLYRPVGYIREIRTGSSDEWSRLMKVLDKDGGVKYKVIEKREIE